MNALLRLSVRLSVCHTFCGTHISGTTEPIQPKSTPFEASWNVVVHWRTFFTIGLVAVCPWAIQWLFRHNFGGLDFAEAISQEPLYRFSPNQLHLKRLGT